MDVVPLPLLGVFFGAYLVGGALGFGTAMVAVTFGAQLLSLGELLPLVVPMNLSLASYLCLRYRRHVDFRLLFRRILPLVALGLPFGMALFRFRDVRGFRLAFGVLVTGLAGLQLRREGQRRRGAPMTALPRPVGRGLLWLGGLIQGLFLTGGPLIVYVLGREIEDKRTFRSTLAAMWLPVNGTLFVGYAAQGLYTPRVMGGLTQVWLPTVLGLLAGELVHHRLNANRFRLAVWGMLLLGGIVLVARAIPS